MVDRPMYRYYVTEEKPYIEITSLLPRKRIFFELKEKNQYTNYKTVKQILESRLKVKIS